MSSSAKPKRALIAYCVLADRLKTPGLGLVQAMTPFLAEACQTRASNTRPAPAILALRHRHPGLPSRGYAALPRAASSFRVYTPARTIHCALGFKGRPDFSAQIFEAPSIERSAPGSPRAPGHCQEWRLRALTQPTIPAPPRPTLYFWGPGKPCECIDRETGHQRHRGVPKLP
jgi:hypothetical protein